jgi:hypothetical protein
MSLKKQTYRVSDSLIDLFVKTWVKHNPNSSLEHETINEGWCYQFAPIIKEIFGEEAKIISNSFHAWVRIGRKHYDSDHPNGVSLQEIGWSIREKPFVVGSTDELRQFWLKWHGLSGELRKDIIEEVVNTFKSNTCKV